jgi:DNA-directed RNA polymerase subunit L
MTRVLTLKNEGHTLGNMLQMGLQEDARVLFAGYSLPAHSQIPLCELKFRLRPGYDAKQVLQETVQARIELVDAVTAQLTAQLAIWKQPPPPSRSSSKGSKRPRGEPE